jgi:hypothetical protein
MLRGKSWRSIPKELEATEQEDAHPLREGHAHTNHGTCELNLTSP